MNGSSRSSACFMPLSLEPNGRRQILFLEDFVHANGNMLELEQKSPHFNSIHIADFGLCFAGFY